LEHQSRGHHKQGPKDNKTRYRSDITRRESIDESDPEESEAVPRNCTTKPEQAVLTSRSGEGSRDVAFSEGPFKPDDNHVDPQRRLEKPSEPSQRAVLPRQHSDGGPPNACVAKRTQLPALLECAQRSSLESRPGTGPDDGSPAVQSDGGRPQNLGAPSEGQCSSARVSGGVRQFKEGLRTFTSPNGAISNRQARGTPHAADRTETQQGGQKGEAPGWQDVRRGERWNNEGPQSGTKGGLEGQAHPPENSNGENASEGHRPTEQLAMAFSPRALVVHPAPCPNLAQFFSSYHTGPATSPVPSPSPSPLDLLSSMQYQSDAPAFVQNLFQFQQPQASLEKAGDPQGGQEPASGVSGIKNMLRKKQLVRPGKSPEPKAAPVILEGKPVQLDKKAPASPRSPVVSESSAIIFVPLNC
jgi:hypothetical protein